MREDLLGYLLGALDPDERCRIESELARSPQLRGELRKLRQHLEPLETLNQEVEPPEHLVEGVEALIARHEEASCRPVPRSLITAGAGSVERIGRYAASDGIVLALVGLVAFTLFLPALANSRYLAGKIACQDNLRGLGFQLLEFSGRQPDRSFPFVPVSGNRSFAGVFAPTLLDSHLIPRRCSWLVCPGAVRDDQNAGWSVPTLQEIDRARGYWLVKLQSRAGGSYAYSIGYVENGRYRAVRNRGRASFALLADMPSLYLQGRLSANHGGRGQNIFYEDGHILFVIDPANGCGDDPLRNRFGFAEYGADRDDAVLLGSIMRPVVELGRDELLVPVSE